MAPASMPVTVMGIGNILMRDDGAGVRALEALQRGYTFPPNVRLVDAGTTVFHNMGIMAESEKMIVLDAVKLDGPPGAVYRFNTDEYRVKMPRQASSHDVGLLNALSMMQLIDQKPPEVIVIGVQPGEYSTWGETLTPEVSAAVPEMVTRTLNQLAQWGIHPVSN